MEEETKERKETAWAKILQECSESGISKTEWPDFYSLKKETDDHHRKFSKNRW